MWRRSIGLVLLLTLGLLVMPVSAGAPPPKVSRIGILYPCFRPPPGALFDVFQQGLRDLGYVEGENIALELRCAAVPAKQLDALAAELVELNVDVLLAAGTPQAQAAKRATTRIPIVFIATGDAVDVELIASLAQPGGNLSGLTILTPEQSGKRLELLTEAVPGISRVAVLWDPASRWNTREVRVMEAVAPRLGVQLHLLAVRGPGAFAQAFEDATRAGAGALSVLIAPFITRNLRSIVDLALTHRLPTIFWMQQFAEAGGLMAYGPSQRNLNRRAAYYVDRILKGAKPADLPVEQPMTFELVINLKTAQALGLTLPPSLLFQATEVIR
jgi:putative tryptophan/tyrosine transport system substrate-binding protein